MLRIKYSDEIENQMKAYFDTLNEKDRRRYAAIEAIKLGHGGQKGSSLFLMDKMLFQFTRIGFCDDIHTKQRRADKSIYVAYLDAISRLSWLELMRSLMVQIYQKKGSEKLVGVERK